MYFIQTFIGIFVVDKLMVANMNMLDVQQAEALTNPMFLQNHMYRQYAVMVQIILTFLIFAISVFKPWKKKKTS
ncbi:hypothetical protein NQ117_02355 [Paenibacillus sp. SC116]|nr:hypothetical protein [Paenibacillus sp. SC116]